MGEPPRLKLLLDTHVWIWALLQPEELARDVARELKDPRNELWLSPVSVWETLILTERGRLQLDAPSHLWVEEALGGFAVRDAPLTRAVALASRAVDLPHQDPADRFIAATALIYGLVLVTRDHRLLSAATGRVMPA